MWLGRSRALSLQLCMHPSLGRTTLRMMQKRKHQSSHRTNWGCKAIFKLLMTRSLWTHRTTSSSAGSPAPSRSILHGARSHSSIAISSSTCEQQCWQSMRTSRKSVDSANSSFFTKSFGSRQTLPISSWATMRVSFRRICSENPLLVSHCLAKMSNQYVCTSLTVMSSCSGPLWNVNTTSGWRLSSTFSYLYCNKESRGYWSG